MSKQYKVGYKVYFKIVVNSFKKELHVNKDRELVEDHKAISRMIDANHEDAVGIEARWREQMAEYGPHMTECY